METEESAVQLVFSRKGFDSKYGGCPSPILDDGTMVSLPIPDHTKRVRYGDLAWRGVNLGGLVERLGRSTESATSSAHLDPDIRMQIVGRGTGWRPLFGQTGRPQGHLRIQGVGPGDIFLFFGLFRHVNRELQWVGPKMHVLWGWLQVDAVTRVDAVRDDQTGAWDWAKDHPHLAHRPDPQNTLYVGSRELALAKHRVPMLPGTGIFEKYDPRLRLTGEGKSASVWAVPSWLIPNGRTPLSYHGDPNRWTVRGSMAELKSAYPGQEFVLRADEYPEAVPWALGLIREIGTK